MYELLLVRLGLRIYGNGENPGKFAQANSHLEGSRGPLQASEVEYYNSSEDGRREVEAHCCHKLTASGAGRARLEAYSGRQVHRHQFRIRKR